MTILIFFSLQNFQFISFCQQFRDIQFSFYQFVAAVLAWEAARVSIQIKLYPAQSLQRPWSVLLFQPLVLLPAGLPEKQQVSGEGWSALQAQWGWTNSPLLRRAWSDPAAQHELVHLPGPERMVSAHAPPEACKHTGWCPSSRSLSLAFLNTVLNPSLNLLPAFLRSTLYVCVPIERRARRADCCSSFSPTFDFYR